MTSTSPTPRRRTASLSRLAVLTTAASLALAGCAASAAPAVEDQGPIASFTYGIPTPPSSLDLTRNMNG